MLGLALLVLGELAAIFSAPEILRSAGQIDFAASSLIPTGTHSLDPDQAFLRVPRRRRTRSVEPEAIRGGKRGRWSKKDHERLKELYGLRDNAVIARVLNRTLVSVVRQAGGLFPPEVTRRGPWTANETLELKRYFGAAPPDVIARILGRSVEEVQAQIMDLGRLRQRDPWTRDEAVQFKRIYGTRADEDLSRIFGRSVTEIRARAQEDRLSKDKAFLRRFHGRPTTRMPRWKQEELDLLRRHYPIQSNVEVARQLGRSVKSVVSKAHQLHLRKTSERLREMGRANVSARYQSAVSGAQPTNQYPRGVQPAKLFGHLIESSVTSQQWHIPRVRRPNQEQLSFERRGEWLLSPAEPYFEAKKVFLTGGGAISYAESCMGIVEHYRLAEIVGGPTAGTNGNVNPIELPGGYRVSCTGMKVLKHDGSRHHGVGIQPTVAVERTRDGVAEGRDEILERAIALVQR